MIKNEDGQVVLDKAEAETVAEALDLAEKLADAMEAESILEEEDYLEVKLFKAVRKLQKLGVTTKNLTGTH